uniref:K Homology domain-containing protein n=3 Tax=Meloidogyne TaxID=189290 RepID=A0A6V7UFQ7_MELEN|nr:unnamed protein product [Meloidogyne enterolobii]
MIVNPMDNIGSYITTQGASILSRDGNYSTAYNATIPLGINPQPLYIQNPASVTTGHHQFASPHNFSLVPQNSLPTPIHIKTRVYVPNQIIGILIGTKGQTIKSVIAECGAIIRIEGDRDPTPSSSSVHQNTNNSVAASQENSYNNNSKSTTTCVEDPSVITSDHHSQEVDDNAGDKTSNGPIVAPAAVDSLETCKEATITSHVNGGHKKNNIVAGHPPSPDQRGVFISGYDFQVSRALFWVFKKVADSQNFRVEDLVLTCEAIVPSKVVGRIIGKNGQNVKRLQLKSGANIKVPEDLNQQDKNSVEAAVRVVGNFYAVQMVQHHFGTLILDTEWRESREYDEKRSGFRRSMVAYDPPLSNFEYSDKQYYASQGMLVNPLDNFGQYITTQGFQAYSTAYNTAIPLGPQSLYIQNPASITGFQNTTGHQYASAHNFSLVPQNSMPNPVHIKTRVYVPNQIVGILIGTKGQTIKSVIAECSAIIRIEGDRDPTPSSSSVHQNTNNSVAASQENSYNNNSKSTTTCVEDPSVITSDHHSQEVDDNAGDKTSNGPIVAPAAVDSLETCKEATITSHVNGGHKKNNIVAGHPPSPDQRGVFISGYDFQVSRALFWVFKKVADSQNFRFEDLVLTCEAIVPSKVVGRIIGKNGQNVKRLQLKSGANIKVPEDLNQQDKNSVEAAVRVVGNFYAVQMVQHHFGTLILDTEWRESREYDEKRSRFREGAGSGGDAGTSR